GGDDIAYEDDLRIGDERHKDRRQREAGEPDHEAEKGETWDRVEDARGGLYRQVEACEAHDQIGQRKSDEQTKQQRQTSDVEMVQKEIGDARGIRQIPVPWSQQITHTITP